MSLILNEEQIFLKDSAKKFAAEKTPTKHLREIREIVKYLIAMMKKFGAKWYL